jgi:hypothetical protein
MSALPPKADIQTNVADCLAVIQAPTTEQQVMRYELSDYEWSVIRPMLPNLAANYLAFVASIRLWLRFYECRA